MRTHRYRKVSKHNADYDLFVWGKVKLPHEINVGDLEISTRSAACRGCGRVMPKATERYCVNLTYDYRGFRTVRMNAYYCLACAKENIKEVITDMAKNLRKARRIEKKMTPDKIEGCKDKMKEIEVLEAI